MASTPSTGPRDTAGISDSAPVVPKVPIPRLRRASKSRDEAPGAGNSGQSPVDSKHRVSHACEPCRQRKTKCSGERPICKHCQDFKISCYYADGKRDRVKNEMINLKTRVDIYENLLEQLKAQVDSAGQLAITKALRGLRAQDSSVSQLRDQVRDGESLVSADVGSTGSMDHIKEDFNADSLPYPTGYMGKSSEVAWIQRVAQQLAEEADQSPNNKSRKSSFSRSTVRGKSFDSAVADEEYQFQTPAYHLDDLSVSLPSGRQIDPYLLPDKKVADQLINTYFITFHPSFPIVSRNLFMTQYNTLFETFFPPGSSKRWLAMLNLKFAIGALYAKLINAEWKGNDTEHLKYFARARLLCLDEGSILEVADLQQVQVIGLAGMYLLASNQTNRAWHVIGLAIRFAQTLGLNLRNDVQEFDEVEKELRVRMWYALYSIEYIICFMTGRPASIRNKDCSAPLPRPIDEEVVGSENFDSALRQYSEDALLTPSTSNSNTNSNSGAYITPPLVSGAASQTGGSNPRTPIGPGPDASLLSVGIAHPSSHTPNSSRSPFSHPQSPLTRASFQYTSSYFLEHTKLNKITSTVLSSLYSPDTIHRSWSDIQGIISSLELSVVKWRADLPPIWDFGTKHIDQSFSRERTALAFQYHNARILINRPCLCRLDYRIPNESNRSRGFNRSAAATCVGGARETVALLSDEPDPIGLIMVSPWWCLLHYLVSAGAILMVEISMRAEHNPQQAEGLLSDAKKIVRWLRAMSKDNIAAERSWAVLSKLLIVSAPKIGGDTSDVERDLDDATLTSVDKYRNVAMQDGGPVHGGIDGAIGEQAHTPIVFCSTTEPMGDVQDIFRGFLEDPFPFGNIPINSPFDNLMNMAPTQFHPSTTGPTEPQFATSAPTFSNSSMEFSPTQPDIQGGDSNRLGERLQKRLSRGVSNISMPPPPKFPQWSTADEFGMNHMPPSCESGIERGRADLHAATASVNLDSLSPCSSPDKSRKRMTDGCMRME